ncbi:hypothetical protein [Leifsonia sp. Le1]|uniref:hypothetical protein n=1 Tax=Leifsonia sp. Le1 TaxID=3404918 RepID=UPI003EC03E61
MAVDEANRETADRGDFDPRYDPAFQRGYQPKPGERPATRMRDAAATAAFQRPAPRAVDPVERADRAERVERVDASADAEYDVVEAEAVPYAPPTGAAPAPATAPALTAAPALAHPASGGILATVDFSPRRNRAVLTLWLVGGGLVALGILLYVMSVFTSYTNPTSGADVTGLVFSQLGWMLAGPLITVGLATLVLLLALTLLSARPALEPVAEATHGPEQSD